MSKTKTSLEDSGVVQFKSQEGHRSFGIGKDTTVMNSSSADSSDSEDEKVEKKKKMYLKTKSMIGRQMGRRTQGFLRRAKRWISQKWDWENFLGLVVILLLVCVGYWAYSKGLPAIEQIGDRIWEACEEFWCEHLHLITGIGIVAGLFGIFWVVKQGWAEDYMFEEEENKREKDYKNKKKKDKVVIPQSVHDQVVKKDSVSATTADSTFVHTGRTKKDPMSSNRNFWGSSAKEDWGDFKFYFTRMSAVNNWEPAVQLQRLMVHLRGDAESFANGLDAAQRATYESLLKAMDARFGVFERTASYVAELELRVKKKEEDYREFGQAIEQLCRKAYPGSYATAQTMALQNFTRGCGSPSVSHHIRLGRPKDMMEAVELAYYYDFVVNGTEKAAITKTRAVASVVAVDSHTAPRGQSNWRGRGRGRGGPVSSGGQKFEFGQCFECGSRDHYKDACPSLSRVPGPNPNNQRNSGGFAPAAPRPDDNNMQCYNCQGYGHMSRDCTTPDTRNSRDGGGQRGGQGMPFRGGRGGGRGTGSNRGSYSGNSGASNANNSGNATSGRQPGPKTDNSQDKTDRKDKQDQGN